MVGGLEVPRVVEERAAVMAEAAGVADTLEHHVVTSEVAVVADVEAG